MTAIEWKKVLVKGMPKLVEQSIVIIVLVVFVVFFIIDRNKSAEREIQANKDLIEYLKTDQNRAIEALEESNRQSQKQLEQSEKQTDALKENSRLLRDLLRKL